MEIVQELQDQGADVLYYGGYPSEAGLILRQARERGHELQLGAGDGIGTKDFGLVAGPSSDGTLVTLPPGPPATAETAELAARLGESTELPWALSGFAAVEVWAQAAGKAASFETAAVAAALRAHTFETVLGTIGFDDKGDIVGIETFAWFIWEGGNLHRRATVRIRRFLGGGGALGSITSVTAPRLGDFSVPGLEGKPLTMKEPKSNGRAGASSGLELKPCADLSSSLLVSDPSRCPQDGPRCQSALPRP